jgi:hypothetical protein
MLQLDLTYESKVGADVGSVGLVDTLINASTYYYPVWINKPSV